jgi:hypothetical protein
MARLGVQQGQQQQLQIVRGEFAAARKTLAVPTAEAAGSALEASAAGTAAMMMMAANRMPERMEREAVQMGEAARGAVHPVKTALKVALSPFAAAMSVMAARAAFGVMMMAAKGVPKGMQRKKVRRGKAVALMAAAMMLGIVCVT